MLRVLFLRGINMSKIKINIIIKDIIAFSECSNKNSFFKDLKARLVNSNFASNISLEKAGIFKATYYIDSNASTDDIHGYILEIIGETLKKSAVAITVNEISSNISFSATKNESCLYKEEKKGTNKNISEDEKKNNETTISINHEIERILEIKNCLSEKVCGQDFAIETITDALFEAEVFAKNNPDRSTPLLSLLFLGPSGVGKTFLSKELSKLLNKEVLMLDMSAFDGSYLKKMELFCHKHEDGILVFDEFEKAPPKVFTFFLQILDEARLDDMSFKNNILILTTNAGKSLYEDVTSRNLSTTPKRVILDALEKDINPETKLPRFPTGITTRFANGHVVLFNHLEPYALMKIIIKEINTQIDIFKKATGIEVDLDERRIAATILYSSGGVADARMLRGTAKNIIIKELYDAMSLAKKSNATIKSISLAIDKENAEPNVKALFTLEQQTVSLVFSNEIDDKLLETLNGRNHTLLKTTDISTFKSSLHNIVDYIIIDPLCGLKEMDSVPRDIEDWKSDGNNLIFYILEHYSDIPLYILNSDNRDDSDFTTLLSKGAKGIINYSNANTDEFISNIRELTYCSLINNSAFSLARSNKALKYNCAQYISDNNIVISFEKLELKQVPLASDSTSIFFGNKGIGETFDDVIGCKAAKEAMQDIADCINNPREFLLSGKKVPKGILMYGKPGTGKTMLARAFANEVGAAFLPITATTFFNSYVGKTEKNIHNIFVTARKYAPAIIFIDEVDAIGKARTGSASTSHNADALTTFLAEMDSFGNDEKRPVFVIAATNYSIDGSDGPALDPAFVRRFDRHVYFDYPTTEDRHELFEKLLAKHNINFGADHEAVLNNLATRSVGMSNADIVSMINCYIRSNKENETTPKSIMDAMDNFRFGEIKEFNPDSIKQTAYHEAGHALIYKLLTGTPSYLTIVSRGNFGGYMEHANDSDKSSFTYSELLNRICVSLSGRAAETLVYGNDSGNNTGASSDVENARKVLKAALTDYAMGEKLYQETTPEEYEKIMQDQLQRATTLLTENRKILDDLTELLVKEKSLDQVELDKFFEGKI